MGDRLKESASVLIHNDLGLIMHAKAHVRPIIFGSAQGSHNLARTPPLPEKARQAARNVSRNVNGCDFRSESLQLVPIGKIRVGFGRTTAYEYATHWKKESLTRCGTLDSK